MTLRAARVQLAIAVRDERPGDDEAVQQLRLALLETGGPPPDWEIHRQIGDTLRQRDDRIGALGAYVHAVTTAPAEAGPAATAALELFSAGEGSTLAANMRSEDIEALAEAARTSGAPAPALVAARAYRLRSDPGAAVRALESVTDSGRRASGAVITELATALTESGRPEDALQCLDRLGWADARRTRALRAWALLDAGRFREALGAASAALRQDPSALPVRALALFGVGNAGEALALIQSAGTTSRDAALAEAVVRLGAASQDGGSIVDAEAIKAADRAVTIASRLDRATRDVLLVSSQVNLEGCLDVKKGRRQLRRAVAAASGSIGTSRWLRYQRRARASDEWFAYFEAELAAAQDDDERVLEAAGVPTRQRTAYFHDAAMDGLVAEVHRRRGRSADAAEALRAAASSYASAGDLAQAMGAARLAMDIEPTPRVALDLAEYCWQWVDEAVRPANEAEENIQVALREIERVEADLPTEFAGQAAVRRGLLLVKLAPFATEDRQAMWRPVPWLVLAVLLAPTEAWWSAHLAWGLNATPASRAALHFAERALAIDDSGTYPQEAFLATYVNLHGVLDSRAEQLADRYQGDRVWLDSLRLMAGLYSGHNGAVPEQLFDALWAREAAARVMALTDGLKAAQPRLAQVREEALRPPIQWTLASDMALLAGEPAEARSALEAGREAGEVDAEAAVLGLALMEMSATAGASGEDGASAAVEALSRASSLRWVINVDLPLMKLLPSCGPELAAAYDRIAAVAERCLHDRERLAPPPLAAEAELVGDGGLRRQIERLLMVAEAIERGARTEAAALASELANDSEGLMRSGLLEVALQLRGDSAGASNSPATSETA